MNAPNPPATTPTAAAAAAAAAANAAAAIAAPTPSARVGAAAADAAGSSNDSSPTKRSAVLGRDQAKKRLMAFAQQANKTQQLLQRDETHRCRLRRGFLYFPRPQLAVLPTPRPTARGLA